MIFCYLQEYHLLDLNLSIVATFFVDFGKKIDIQHA